MVREWEVEDVVSDAFEEWGARLKAVHGQSTGVLYAALSVVNRLLLQHQPLIDDDHSTAYMCKACWEIWPCDVYEIIQEELKRGE